MHPICYSFKTIGIYCSLILFSIQGDSDIPAGKVSFEVDLRFCMYLSQEMQTDMHCINEIEANPSDWNDLPQPQPFLVPQNCERQFPDLPNNCLAR